MESGRNRDDEIDDWEGASGEGARALFRRLLQKLTRPARAAGGEPSPDSLLPPGQRSGRGTESLEPYLNQYRNSRPSSLE